MTRTMSESTQTSTAHPVVHSHTRSTAQDDQYILSILDHLAHLLPSQGPIKVFVHHNTLHAFEDLPFDEGVIHGMQAFGCEPYFTEQRYHQELQSGRIRRSDLEAVMEAELGASAHIPMFPSQAHCSLGTRHAFRMSMLRFPMEQLPERELQWVISESNAMAQFHREVDPIQMQRMVVETKKATLDNISNPGKEDPILARSELDEEDVAPALLNHASKWSDSQWTKFTLRSLWRVCRKHVRQTLERASDVQAPRRGMVRQRDWLYERTGIDSDRLVHDYMIRISAAYLDQGLSAWEIPDRDRGLWRSFLTVYSTRLGLLPTWLRGLPKTLGMLKKSNTTSLSSVQSSLERLHLARDQWEEYLRESLLALPGWAGMIWQMETSAPWTPKPASTGTLLDFLAIRLLLDEFAAQHVARHELGLTACPSIPEVNQAPRSGRRESPDGIAFALFQVAQVCGWTPNQLSQLGEEDWNHLITELNSFPTLERRRVLHLAYERRYRQEALDAIVAHSPRWKSASSRMPRIPKFQVITCIDDREESFRRHLEEVEPNCLTYGAAGFFGVVMYYRGASEAHYRPLCPINIVPKHFVREEPVFSAAAENDRRERRRRVLGRLTHQVHTGSRTIVGGVITGVLGSLATFPLVARVLTPRITAKVRKLLGGFVNPPATELHLHRTTDAPGMDYESLGYSIAEMAAIVVRILQDIGMVREFSPIVLFLGHGSSSLNNPHESAYNCGACSGGRGGPNARAFAWMANQPKVRKLVAESGIEIPEDVRFVGAYHNTCNDRVDYYDLDLLPHTHRKLFREIEESIHVARQRNALERVRRFRSAPLTLSPAEALEHVEERAEDLSQVRPEYNHATNALCLVGQREWSRGLYLDRRAFLASYDPSIDDATGRIIERILQAAIPVCGGISLEYYFSTVDPEGYGCGSKLPHNITSLAGVMTGAASDLRPGLSAQMVEIHEPIRILFVVQTTEPIMRRIIQDNANIKKLVEGAWVQLAIYDSQRNTIRLFEKGNFRDFLPGTDSIPSVDHSVDWFRGQRENLGFATVESSWPKGDAQ